MTNLSAIQDALYMIADELRFLRLAIEKDQAARIAFERREEEAIKEAENSTLESQMDF